MSIVVDHFISNNKAHMVVIEGNDDSGFFTSEYSGTDVISKVNCPGWVIPPEKQSCPSWSTMKNKANYKAGNHHWLL